MFWRGLVAWSSHVYCFDRRQTAAIAADLGNRLLRVVASLGLEADLHAKVRPTIVVLVQCIAFRSWKIARVVDRWYSSSGLGPMLGRNGR